MITPNIATAAIQIAEILKTWDAWDKAAKLQEDGSDEKDICEREARAIAEREKGELDGLEQLDELDSELNYVNSVISEVFETARA